MVNDKFILMGLDDERSKDIAEVLGNKTCKKILDFLSEIKESSEKDISDGLKIPLNTVEYNLNKLIKSGLVEKTKNFFWSSKGKKIELYKLARKHIVISPNKRFDINNLKAILPVLIVAFAIIALVLYMDLKTVENSRLVLRDNLQMENIPQETNIPQNTKSATGSASVPSADEINLNKNYENIEPRFQLRDKILIIIEIILILSIIVNIFLIFKNKR